jgi:hypothetical protein
LVNGISVAAAEDAAGTPCRICPDDLAFDGARDLLRPHFGFGGMTSPVQET